MNPLPPPTELEPPHTHIAHQADFMAKDYDSFRALMLQQMTQLVPAWQERHAADLGVAIIEVLAYAADLLSYRQDAVALEAYLDTAVDRVSVQRLARLLGYRLANGCNARTVVALRVTTPGVTLPAGTVFTTELPQTGVVVSPDVFGRHHLYEQCTVYESMLPVTIRDVHDDIVVQRVDASGTGAHLGGVFEQLEVGDLLLLSADAAAGKSKREHVVRITQISRAHDGATHVGWHVDDVVDDPSRSWGATANVVLVDHGRTIRRPISAIRSATDRFRLDDAPLTSCVPLHGDDTAIHDLLAGQDPNRALPAVVIDTPTGRWMPCADLLSAGRFDREFAIELATDGSATLRFGDGRYGRPAPPLEDADVVYRVGNGAAGNMSRDEITRIVSGVVRADDVISVTNPLAAAGGVEPETIEMAKLFAPVAHEFDTARCITAEDYATAAHLVVGVHRAAARIETSGPRATVDVFVECELDQAVAEVLAEVEASVHPLRAIGHDVAVRSVRYVDVEIALSVYADEATIPGNVETSVSHALGTSGGVTVDPHAFFAPGRFGFGQPLRMSDLIAVVRAVPGVDAVEITEMRPVGTVGAPPADVTPPRWEIVRAGSGPRPTVALTVRTMRSSV